MLQHTCVHTIKTQCTQVRSRPARKHTEGAGSYCELLFASGDEGSDSLDEADSGEEVDASYDPVTESAPTFNKKWGEDSWIDRRVIKSFGEHGNFCDIVHTHGADKDENNATHRLFMVNYFDDPDDVEYMWSEELMQ